MNSLGIFGKVTTDEGGEAMPVFNVMENVVRNVLQSSIDQLHLNCSCDRCLDDILAITLNQLPPRYIVDDALSPYVKADHLATQQGATNILSAITKAAVVVSESPRCNQTKSQP